MVDFAQSLGVSRMPDRAAGTGTLTRPVKAETRPGPGSTSGSAETRPRRVRGRAVSLWFAGVGAVAYCSWPLAFLVNRSLAGSALASSFESRSEPFAWLFILLDCVAGLCIAVVCARELRPRVGGALAVVLLAYAAFGAATAVDAVVPLDCGSVSAQACAGQLWPITPDDVLTGTAVFALFVAAVTVLAQAVRRAREVPSRVPVIMMLILAGWSVSGLVVLAANTSGSLAAVCQYAFLTLTAILSFLVARGATGAIGATRFTDA